MTVTDPDPVTSTALAVPAGPDPHPERRPHRGGKRVVGAVLSELRRDPGEHRGRWWAGAVNGLAAAQFVPVRARTVLYRLLGLDIALSAQVRPGAIFRTQRVRIGAGSTVNYRCVFDNRVPVEIGADVGIAMGVTFVTSSHEVNDPRRRAGTGSLAPISIGDGCWIGSGATILPGVRIEPGVVVAAGSVVTRDCAAHGVYAGVPARRIKDLPVAHPRAG